MKQLKLNQKGIAHILAPILFIALFAAIGGYVLLKSHAAPLATTETQTSTTYTNGRIYSGGYTLNPNATLIDEGVKDVVPANSGSFPLQRAWSNMSFDGKHVAYTGLDPYKNNVNALFVDMLSANTGKIEDLSSKQYLPSKYQWPDMPPAWSPDGSMLALVVHANSGDTFPYQRIWISPANGSAAHFVSNPNLPIFFSPFVAWRPSSARIMYVPAASSASGTRICSIGINGEARICKTIDTSTINLDGIGGIGQVGLAVSPTGGKVALVAENSRSHQMVSSNIYTVDPDGHNLKLVAKLPAGQQVKAVVWSPDGTKIAYYLDDQSVANSAYTGVYVKDANTNNLGKQISDKAHSKQYSLSWAHK